MMRDNLSKIMMHDHFNKIWFDMIWSLLEHDIAGQLVTIIPTGALVTPGSTMSLTM